MATTDPHAPTRADQIGGSVAPSTAGDIYAPQPDELTNTQFDQQTEFYREQDIARARMEMRAKSLDLAIQSLGAPLRDITGSTFIIRANEFEMYLLNGSAPAGEEQVEASSLLKMARAYVENDDGSISEV